MMLRDRHRMRRSRPWVAMAVLVALGASAHAECKIEGVAASLDQANTFLKAPKVLFHRGADGLPRVTFAVMQLATNAPVSRLVALKPIFAKASAAQQEAIGKGLYQGYAACLRTSFTDATAIRAMVFTMGDPALLAAFQRSQAKMEEPPEKAVAVDDRIVRHANDARLNALMPGMQESGSLDLADPTALPGD